MHALVRRGRHTHRAPADRDPLANPLLATPARALPRAVAIIGAGTIGPDIGYYLKSASGKTYKVQSGDTVGGIAARFGISMDDLRRMNGLTTDFLSIDQELLLEAPPTPPTTSAISVAIATNSACSQ